MTELIKQKKQVPERLYSNKKLAALLIPLALDQLLNSFMGTIDTLVVSNLGSAAISAVSLVDSINILIVQAFFALASGGTVVCSHYLGCKSKDHAKEAARQLVFVTLMLSLIIGAICLVFNQQILNLIFGKVERMLWQAQNNISFTLCYHIRLSHFITMGHAFCGHRIIVSFRCRFPLYLTF